MIWIDPKEQKLKSAFQKIKDELDDHLQAINENTNEISSYAESLRNIEDMISKLYERLDDIELRVSQGSDHKILLAEDFKDVILNTKEKEIFMLLYSKRGNLITHQEIARNLGITEESSYKIISSLLQKGIPLVKKYLDSKCYLALDSDFIDLQAKKNIIN